MKFMELNMTLEEKAKYIINDIKKENYAVALTYSASECDYSSINQQCIKEHCPFYK